ncbi:MAG: GntR family transcriptional regulator [Parvibaculaceae bacterium]
MDLKDNSASFPAWAEAYNYLRERIRNGQLKSGERIKAEDIAAQLGISRMPVREAIRQLDNEGLLTIRANRGAVVTVLKPDEIVELFEMRSVLEGVAIKRAIKRFDEDDFATLDIHLMRLGRAQDDPSLWIERHNEFHDFICARSGATRLFTEVRQLRTAVEPYLRLVLGIMRSGDAVADHRKVIDVMRKGDPDIAEAVIREHVLSTAYDLIKTMPMENQRL